jgi:hypothetical protein
MDCGLTLDRRPDPIPILRRCIPRPSCPRPWVGHSWIGSQELMSDPMIGETSVRTSRLVAFTRLPTRLGNGLHGGTNLPIASRNGLDRATRNAVRVGRNLVLGERPSARRARLDTAATPDEEPYGHRGWRPEDRRIPRRHQRHASDRKRCRERRQDRGLDDWV